jgi:hypothetical protein
MKKSIKLFSFVLAMLFFSSIPNYILAISVSDYKALKYATVTSVSQDTVQLSGKGFMGVTTTQGPDSASAMIYNTPIDVKNLSCTLKFIDDYGQGEGSQSGWYALNIGRTLNWFSSVKAVIQAANINGVTIVFKLNPNDKKELLLELWRYSPGSGFVNIVGNSITTTMSNDWECVVSIQNGKLNIDGSDIVDLSDALDLAIGSGKSGYLGFGGFSENHYDIKMNVTYKGITSTTSSEIPQNSSQASSQNSNTSIVSQVTSSSSNASTEESISSTQNSSSEISNIQILSSDAQISSTNTSGSPQNSLPIIIVILIILSVGAGIVYFFVKKKKG